MQKVKCCVALSFVIWFDCFPTEGSDLLCVFVSDWCVTGFKPTTSGLCEKPVGEDKEKVQREKQQILILFFLSPAPSRDTRSAPLANEAITDIIMRPVLMQTAPYYVPNTQTIPSIEAT